MRMKNHFHIKALNLVLIQRPRGTSEMAYCIMRNCESRKLSFYVIVTVSKHTNKSERSTYALGSMKKEFVDLAAE